MQVNQSHLDQASRLVTGREKPLAGTGGAPPAFDSFLAAIKRIQPVLDSQIATAEVEWLDATQDEGQAYLATPVANPTLDAAPIRLSLSDESADESSVHAFSPDDAERLGWELIALAHLARTGDRA